jgi:hypothetical protein
VNTLPTWNKGNRVWFGLILLVWRLAAECDPNRLHKSYPLTWCQGHHSYGFRHFHVKPIKLSSFNIIFIFLLQVRIRLSSTQRGTHNSRKTHPNYCNSYTFTKVWQTFQQALNKSYMFLTRYLNSTPHKVDVSSKNWMHYNFI